MHPWCVWCIRGEGNCKNSAMPTFGGAECDATGHVVLSAPMRPNCSAANWARWKLWQIFKKVVYYRRTVVLIRTHNRKKLIRVYIIRVYHRTAVLYTQHADHGALITASKTVEMIIHKPRFNVALVPAPLPGVSRQSQLKILGVIITDTLSFEEHINNVTTRVAQAGYALRTLKAHGLVGRALWDVACATTISRLTYASPAWYGFLNKNQVNKAQGAINRLKRGGFLPPDQEDFCIICENADQRLFNNVLCNHNHVLHQLLPPVKSTPYNLRSRIHNRMIPSADNNLRKNFIYRLLYKDTY